MKVLKKKIQQNTAIIADIHQCNSMLMKLIDTCREAGVNNFIFLGDILDRGEDAVGTVKTLIDIKDISTFLIGNHDYKLTRYAEGRGVTLTDEQSHNVTILKENGIFDEYINFFSQEWVAILDEEQKVMLSHAPGGRPARFMEKYNKLELGKNDFSRVIYGITTGDTLNGRPVRMPLTERSTDNLDGWVLIHGHTHGNRLYSEISKNVMCLDFLAGEPDGRVAAWVVDTDVISGRLLVVNQRLEVAWNPEIDMLPYTPA